MLSQKPCLENLRTGQCSWGEKCKFSHTLPRPEVLLRSDQKHRSAKRRARRIAEEADLKKEDFVELGEPACVHTIFSNESDPPNSAFQALLEPDKPCIIETSFDTSIGNEAAAKPELPATIVTELFKGKSSELLTGFSTVATVEESNSTQAPTPTSAENPDDELSDVPVINGLEEASHVQRSCNAVLESIDRAFEGACQRSETLMTAPPSTSLLCCHTRDRIRAMEERMKPLAREAFLKPEVITTGPLALNELGNRLREMLDSGQLTPWECHEILDTTIEHLIRLKVHLSRNR